MTDIKGSTLIVGKAGSYATDWATSAVIAPIYYGYPSTKFVFIGEFKSDAEVYLNNFKKYLYAIDRAGVTPYSDPGERIKGMTVPNHPADLAQKIEEFADGNQVVVVYDTASEMTPFLANVWHGYANAILAKVVRAQVIHIASSGPRGDRLPPKEEYSSVIEVSEYVKPDAEQVNHAVTVKAGNKEQLWRSHPGHGANFWLEAVA